MRVAQARMLLDLMRINWKQCRSLLHDSDLLHCSHARIDIEQACKSGAIQQHLKAKRHAAWRHGHRWLRAFLSGRRIAVLGSSSRYMSHVFG